MSGSQRYGADADTDAEANRENLLRMIALKERLPELVIVPAHDMRAFAEMPRLPQASTETPHRRKHMPASSTF